jgi:putative hydrolase of the HAD superfamily
MIRNIIFDMGGVLVDVRRERAVAAFRALGVAEADSLIDACRHRGVFLEIENGALDADAFCRRLSEYAGRDLAFRDVEQAWMSIVSQPPMYRLDFLSELRASYSLFLLSNNNPILMNAWALTGRFSPAGRPLTDYFDRLYLSYQLKCAKPDPLIFRKMILDSGIDPAESLFIDDGADNIKTAGELGFHTLLAENGADWRPEVLQILRRR